MSDVTEFSQEESEAIDDLDRLCPRWRRLAGEQYEPTPFRIWLAAQPRDYQRSVNESWSVVIIAGAINKFLAERKVH